MTREQFFKYHQNILKRMTETTVKKNADYAGHGDDDPFANFKIVEITGACSTELGFYTRMSDKMSRLLTFIKKGVLEVADEKIEDTLIDLANYCILLAAYIKSKRNEKAKGGQYTITYTEPDSRAFAGDRGGSKLHSVQLGSGGTGLSGSVHTT